MRDAGPSPGKGDMMPRPSLASNQKSVFSLGKQPRTDLLFATFTKHILNRFRDANLTAAKFDSASISGQPKRPFARILLLHAEAEMSAGAVNPALPLRSQE